MSDTETAPRTGRRRGPYAKSEQRRRQILDAAAQVFGENGYRAGSLKDIAALTDLNATSLLHYFPTKDALLQAVLDDRDAISDRVALGESGQVSAEETPEAFLRIARNNETAPGIIGLYTLLAAESATPDHPSRTYFIERYRRIRTQFQSVFAVMAEQGLLAPGVTAEYAAASTLGLWDGIQMQWMIEPDAIDVVEHLRHHLSMITTVDV